MVHDEKVRSLKKIFSNKNILEHKSFLDKTHENKGVGASQPRNHLWVAFVMLYSGF